MGFTANDRAPPALLQPAPAAMPPHMPPSVHSFGFQPHLLSSLDRQSSSEPLADWITCAEDLAPAARLASAVSNSGGAPLPPGTPGTPSSSGRRRSCSSSSDANASKTNTGCLRTSMEIFMRHVRERADGSIDASGIMSKQCFAEWVKSRKNKLKNPHLTFVHTVRSHVTGERKTGRNPFPPKVEADLLTLFRQRRVWPCFEGTGVKYGIRGMYVTGYHEGRGTLVVRDSKNSCSGCSEVAVAGGEGVGAADIAKPKTRATSKQQQQQQQQIKHQQDEDVQVKPEATRFEAAALLDSLSATTAPPPKPDTPALERCVSWREMPLKMTMPAGRSASSSSTSFISNVNVAAVPSMQRQHSARSADAATAPARPATIRQSSLGPILLPPPPPLASPSQEQRPRKRSLADELVELLSDEGDNEQQQEVTREMDSSAPPHTKQRRVSV